MDYLIYIPITIGVCCGAFLAYWTTKPLVQKFARESDSFHLAQWGALVGALLMALPAFVFAMIGGGSLGGALAELAGNNNVLEHIGVPLGLVFGIAIVLGGGLAVGIVSGCLLGSFIVRALHKPAPGNSSS